MKYERLLLGIWNAFVGIGVFTFAVASAIVWGYL